MIRDITIGQYYPADSLLHRLDPRVKLMGTLVFIVSLFIADNWLGYVLAAAFLALMIQSVQQGIGGIILSNGNVSNHLLPPTTCRMAALASSTVVISSPMGKPLARKACTIYVT